MNYTYQKFNLKGHERPIVNAQFNLDGDMFLTSSIDKTVCVWCALTCRLLHQFKEFTAAVRAAEFSPDSNYIAAGQNDTELFVFDLSTMRVSHQRTLPPGIKGARSVHWRPDMSSFLVVTASYGASVQVLEYAFSPSQPLGPPARAAALECSPVSSFLLNEVLYIGCDSGNLLFFNAETFEIDEIEDLGYPAADISLFRDAYVAIACTKARKVYVYDAREKFALKTEFDVNTFCAHPTLEIGVLGGGIDAKSVTTTSNVDATLVTQFYDLEHKTLIWEQKLHAGPSWRVRWSPDGLGMISVAEDASSVFIRFESSFLGYSFKAEW
ncbi:Eukaryotic translation initiation factor 3 [Spironucleus salmonicida]|uniref:Serine-threonine kinase receptor-associated protein n=1 Tax=Spironucleus salmonicida TaxID=348837 RepID=V6M1I2_9EUKA|nr:Eukaryotic translation initiation factor 3 [Spironucleus salmonicida]|eukprot:EST47049.1 Eukaryotic translation initiation factor 3 [Spironucleus salmonicida]